jgi:hypothetical protein
MAFQVCPIETTVDPWAIAHGGPTGPFGLAVGAGERGVGQDPALSVGGVTLTAQSGGAIVESAAESSQAKRVGHAGLPQPFLPRQARR